MHNGKWRLKFVVNEIYQQLYICMTLGTDIHDFGSYLFISCHHGVKVPPQMGTSIS